MNRIRLLRRERQMRQSDLAVQMNVGQNTISNWETGKTEPDSASLQKMSLLFEASIDYILGNDGVERGKPTPLWVSGLSEDALEVATAYDQAEKKDRNTVRFILADYLPKPLAAREGDGAAPTEEEVSGVTVAGEDHELP